MKIGILSDIHGNASALVEVLHEAKKLKIERTNKEDHILH